jgi:hypothetical protein
MHAGMKTDFVFGPNPAVVKNVIRRSIKAWAG